MLLYFLEIRAIPLSYPINQTDHFKLLGEAPAQYSSSIITLLNFCPKLHDPIETSWLNKLYLTDLLELIIL